MYDNKSTFTLSFDSVLPNPLRAGTRTLQLDNKFAAQMRLSPKYPAKVGANGFVVLLHDPHDNIAGRAETLAGLRSLISANSRVPFTFLVEGAYQDPRNIGFSGLDMLINTGSDTSTAVVYSLLNRYMINGPAFPQRAPATSCSGIRRRGPTTRSGSN